MSRNPFPYGYLMKETEHREETQPAYRERLYPSPGFLSSSQSEPALFISLFFLFYAALSTRSLMDPSTSAGGNLLNSITCGRDSKHLRHVVQLGQGHANRQARRPIRGGICPARMYCNANGMRLFQSDSGDCLNGAISLVLGSEAASRKGHLACSHTCVVTWQTLQILGRNLSSRSQKLLLLHRS